MGKGAFAYSTHKLEYRLRFSDRRTLAITVRPDGTIHVVAPKGSNPKEIEKRVRKRARWIVRQRLYFEQFHPRTKKRRYIGGETHLYLGRQYRLKLIKGDYDRVQLKRGFLVVSLRGRQSNKRVRTLVSAWYATMARARLMERYSRIAPRFADLGCKISSPKLRRMSRRWGSYSEAGKVLLNPDLVQASSACIDYVIAHELAHAVYPNHGNKFFGLVEKIIPDWKKRKDLLERTLA